MFPFPVSLTGRDLLILFHKFIMLVSCVDVCFGLALSNLYTVVELLGGTETCVLIDVRDNIEGFEGQTELYEYFDEYWTAR